MVVEPEAIGVASAGAHGPAGLEESSAVGDDDVSSTVTGTPAV